MPWTSTCAKAPGLFDQECHVKRVSLCVVSLAMLAGACADQSTEFDGESTSFAISAKADVWWTDCELEQVLV